MLLAIFAIKVDARNSFFSQSIRFCFHLCRKMDEKRPTSEEKKQKSFWKINERVNGVLCKVFIIFIFCHCHWWWLSSWPHISQNKIRHSLKIAVTMQWWQKWEEEEDNKAFVSIETFFQGNFCVKIWNLIKSV